MPRLDHSLLKPSLPVILFFAFSALASIFVDVIQIIDLLLELVPDCLLSGWPHPSHSTTQLPGLFTQSSKPPSQQPGMRLLRLYLSLLSIGPDCVAPGLSTSSANQLTAESKLIVLKSLARFISIATAPDSQSCRKTSMPLWIFRKAFSKQRDFDAFSALLTSHDHQRYHGLNENMLNASEDLIHTNTHLFERFTDAFFQKELPSDKVVSTSGSFPESPSETPKDSTTPETCLSLLRSIYPVLLSLFLESAPEAFRSDLNLTNSPSGSSIPSSLELINCVLTVCHRLWQACIAANLPIEPTDMKSLETILTKMSAYFVFGSDYLTPPGLELKRLLQNLNLMYCDLTSLLVLIKPNWSNAVGIQLDRVGDYVTCLLAAKVDDIKLTPGVMTVEVYRGIFPIVWSLLRHSLIQRDNPGTIPSDWASRVLEAFMEHLHGVNPTSEVKYLGINFLARLCIMDDLPGCQLACALDILNDSAKDRLRQWVLSLPKLLWQLGHKTPETTYLILSFIHRVLGRPMVLFEPCLAELGSLLVPFYSIVHPKSGKILLGPYSRLPLQSQKLAQGIGWYLTHQSDLIDRCKELQIALNRSKATLEQSLPIK